jgi:hypothetical protein
MKKAPSGIARQQKSGVICGFLTGINYSVNFFFPTYRS